MFEQFNPLQGKMLQILDNDGNVIHPEFMPEISDEKLVAAYKAMLYARVADLRAVSYQRQGRMYTYPPNLGQEAAAVGTGMLMEKDDWLVPAYRELGAWLHKGVTMKDLFLFWGGHEDGASFSSTSNMVPLCVPIASQTLHAVGIGYALKYKKRKGIVFTYIGDGGTSQGDFHEALNFAGVWQTPVLFICQNNQYAISMPREKQTASSNIAVKSVAYGMKGIQVDGNDFLATYAATAEAVKYIRSKSKPVLIECITYRQGAHTTSDDPSRYRSEEEEKIWQERDPLKRLRGYLLGKKLWQQDADVELESQYGREIDEQFTQAEQHPYQLEDVFRFMYAEMPEDLHEQQREYERFLKWKEAH